MISSAEHDRARAKAVLLVISMAIPGLLLAACGSAATTTSSTSSTSSGSSIRPITMRFASFVAQNSEDGLWQSYWMSQVTKASKGKIQFKQYWGGTLVGPTDMVSALTTGQIQVGMVTSSYYPGQFPLTAVTDIPFETTNVPAASVALTNLVYQKGPLQAEWERNGLHQLFFATAPPSVLGSKKPISSLSDLKGLKVRGLDSYSDEVMAAGGADPTTIAITGLYESLQTGVVTAYYGVPEAFVTSLKLNEVAPYVIDPQLGIYAANGLSMSLTYWNSLQPAVQKIITTVSQEIPTYAVTVNHSVDASACAALKAAGDHVSVWPDGLVAQLKGLIGHKIYNQWLSAAEKSTPDASQFYSDYQNLLTTESAKFGSYTDDMVTCAAGTS
jgi:TRAP-type transport system periplasmic protein